MAYDHRIRARSRPLLTGLVALLVLAGANPVQAQDADLLHADRPLWVPGAETVWPHAFADSDGFGCVHRMKLGVWRFTPTGDESADSWRRFDNYGVFHCWMRVAEAFEPDAFGDSRPGFLIRLERPAADGRELWALQIGARPGSDYLLLARKTAPGMVDRFDVLQRQCPKGHVRGGPNLDILLTRYCAINARRDLVALAVAMSARPPIGVLAFDHPASENP